MKSTYLKTKTEGRVLLHALSHRTLHFAARRASKTNSGVVDHGSHNVSRWMTWLSISLKNAAACDKWYQLQNHSITESLNANGAWEKPFVGHPRACHTQCRTNIKQAIKKIKGESLSLLSFLHCQNKKSPSSGVAGGFSPSRRGRLARCLLCARKRASLKKTRPLFCSPAARLAQPNFLWIPQKKEKHCAFLFFPYFT